MFRPGRRVHHLLSRLPVVGKEKPDHPSETAAMALARQASLRQDRLNLETDLAKSQLEVDVFEALVGDHDLPGRLRRVCERGLVDARNDRHYLASQYHSLSSQL